MFNFGNKASGIRTLTYLREQYVRSVVTLRSQQGLQANNVWETVHYTKNSVLFLELRKSTNNIVQPSVSGRFKPTAF